MKLEIQETEVPNKTTIVACLEGYGKLAADK